MSKSVVSSLDIVRFGAFQDRLTADPVRAALDRPAAHQIHLPTEQSGELLLHDGVVKQAPLGVRCEGHEKIDIALGAEILTEGRAKQAQLLDLPPAAKFGDCSSRGLEAKVRSHGST